MTIKEIPGPKDGFFGLQSLIEFQKDPIRWLLQVSHDYEDIIHFKFGPTYDVYLLTNPEYVREMLVKNAEKMVKWKRHAKIIEKVAGTHNMLIMEGDDWRVNRKLVSPAFHTQRIKHYIDLMAKHTNKLLESWQDGAVVDMHLQMAAVTMGIIGEVLFDIDDIEKDAAELSNALKVLIEMFMLEGTAILPTPDWVPTPRNLSENEAMRIVDEFVTAIVKKRRAEGKDHGDVMSALLSAVDEDDGGKMTDRQVRDTLITLFTAGHDTTALVMTWTLYLLSQNAEVQEKLYQEVLSVMKGDAPTLEELATMKYTDQVLKESMRLYPPAWSLFLRETIAPVEIGGHTIPEGSVIYISPYVMHHNARLWENPHGFDPSRFEGDYKETHHPYAYMPFGGGPRVCAGSHLAEMKSEVILATLVKHFKFEASEANQHVPPKPLFTLHPDGEVPLRVRRRG
jgi:cytochrome P450